ncbi:dnc-4 [Pristionchus pacificus]|uniref:Dynactin subunit 4 n=1 Tax=Pristionchus pacificus TaxID=54126 RepID=A0A2A6BYM8_PRIPA|nr:dnc-4 [Pristionchus pacificus]|eukprot:PDM70969.1 dnc-4 [Pristionchus pacificus]
MAELLQLDRILYECSCSEWAPLCRLFYCRHCSILRCHSCTANEIDCTFCGTCLENVAVGEARTRKNRCVNCYQCPICCSTLSAHNSGEAIFLSCSTCKWSTFESDIQQQATAGNWKILENPHEEELSCVLDQMKQYELNEKAQRDILKRRSNVVGSRLTDRFGLQQMYQKRKQALERPTWLAPEKEPITVLDELYDSHFTSIVDLSKSLSLESRIMQPLSRGSECRPIRMPLKGRRVLRCTQCTHNLSKLEYSPSSIVFKIQYFARTYVPEIRLWQETKLAEGGICPVFISVVNESVAKADVVLLANNDDSSLECETPVVEFSLPPHDENSDNLSHSISSLTPEDDTIILRKRNRVGLKLCVKVDEVREMNILSLILKWKNELTSMTSDKGQEWRETRVKVLLGKS